MDKVSFSKLKLKLASEINEFDFKEFKIAVKSYLTAKEKADFLSFVCENALDDATGTISPLRQEVYFGLAIVKFYSSVQFTEKQIDNAEGTYDLLETNGLIFKVMNALPVEEREYIEQLTNEVVAAINKYNCSAAGILASMTSESTILNNNLLNILKSIKDKDGMEFLKEIEAIG